MKNIRFLILCSLFLAGSFSLFAQNENDRHYDIAGVNVHAGLNPADWLMERAYELRDTNSAYRCQTFQYVTYQKMTILPTKVSDSLKHLIDQPLFISESVSEVFFKQPNRKYEKLTASKTSGLKNPIFNLIISRLQFQNLYERDYINIFQVDYVSPLSKGSSRLYAFTLTDTLRNGTDSAYVITFVPKYAKQFKSLKGVLHLDAATFAVQYIEVEPVDKNVLLHVKVQHTYRKQENGTWFPAQMQASFKLPRLTEGKDTLFAKGISTVTIQDVKLNPELRNRDFGLADLEEQIGSRQSEQRLFNTYRTDSLTDKELRAYELVDSISKAAKLERRLDMLPSLVNGCIPIGPIDLDLTSIVDYTYYEGWRFGLGLYTNQKLLRFARLGGYFAYGLKDKSWKWGVSTEWELEKKHSILLNIRYFDDITESGGLSLVSRAEIGLLNGEYYRHWIITKFDRSKNLFVRLQMRPNKHLTASISGGMRWNTTLFDYDFQPFRFSDGIGPFSYEYQFGRAGIRFAYDEKTTRAANLTLYEPSRFPTLQLQYEFGRIYQRSTASKEFCHKVNMRIHHLQRYKILGYSEISIDAGWIDKSLPYSLLYVMPAGYEQLGFYGKEQFAVMRPNEFITDSYVAIFLRHNFGKMWEGSFSPRIVLCQNIGFGWLRNPENHIGVNVQGIHKGYYETGLMIDNILSVKDILAMGVGVFFRYGPYGLPTMKDNFAFKVSLTVPMAE